MVRRAPIVAGDVVGVLVEVPPHADRSDRDRALSIVTAAARLQSAGLVVVLLPEGTDVVVKQPRRRWWRREHKEEL